MKNLVSLVAFYLPQFHPIPENDAWWEKGFTEWTNVVRARPLFPGHLQPHLPADLGFYDLRLAETREMQAELARSYGISAFCYYHYWFNGRRLLQRPFEEVLATGRPDFPFCLCWANENWTRSWDGAETEIIVEQRYSPEDDIAHFQALLPAFRDPRYLRIKRRSLFLVYRASRLPDPRATVERWRREAALAGLEGIYVCNVESFASELSLSAALGFDAAVEFAPDRTCLAPLRWRGIWSRLTRKIGISDGVGFRHRICDYALTARNMLAKPQPSYLRFPCVTPSWDNTARRKEHGLVLSGANPQVYREWLQETIARFNQPSPEENLIFINAWNEWAEGNHLEPCQHWRRGYLEATRHVVRGLAEANAL